MPKKALGTPDLRKKAFKQFCDWVSKGNSPYTWVFVHPTAKISGFRMNSYMKEFPEDMPPVDYEIAQAKSLHYWEGIGKELLNGVGPRKGNPAIYQMFMRNKFGWDKADNKKDKDDQLKTELVKFFNYYNIKDEDEDAKGA